MTKRTYIDWEHIPNTARVEDLMNDLSVRAFNALKIAGYDTVGKIRATRDNEFLRLRNVGRITLSEIRGAFGPQNYPGPPPAPPELSPELRQAMALENISKGINLIAYILQQATGK